MEGRDRARQQSALGIDFTVDGPDMDTIRKEVLKSIEFNMVQNDGDESMGLPRFERLTSRDIQTIHDSTPYTCMDSAGSLSRPSTTGSGNSSVSAAVQSQSIASRSVETALEAKHRTNPWSHIPSSLSRLGQAYSYDQPSVAFDEENSTPVEIAAQGHDRLLDSNIAAQEQTTHSSFQADTELMQQSHRPLPTSPYHVLSVEHRRDAGIQRPAHPRLRPLLDRLDALRASVLDCALPVGQPFFPSTRSARRSERSIMNTHYSPVRSMGPGISTMTSLNLSMPLYLRGVEQPRKGGNRNLRNVIFLPSPLRNEINFSTSDRDLLHRPEQTITLHESEKTIGEEPFHQSKGNISSHQFEQTTSSHEPLLPHESKSEQSAPSPELEQPTSSHPYENASSTPQPEHHTSPHSPSNERMAPRQSPPRPRSSTQREYTSSLQR
ncbi:hypothetical protein D6D05_06478 [Aureobasidium pullulans]|nr:hypothetical protein D6D05_06478 [Aureobasidium pullulans]